ncbi:MAG: hypothetical protein LBI96_00885 [Odoribacteraceae bacterium]|jgi:ferric-dicitrate binding protein FerR (iron transport regulator)|nr:hypothetical protein [Odoribacteraceae bacterium]
MEYKDEDVAFAFRLMNERETLDDAEVEEWMRSDAHRRLMNDMEEARAKWEADEASGDERERADRKREEEKSRKMTLRWAVAMAIVVMILLVMYHLTRG